LKESLKYDLKSDADIDAFIKNKLPFAVRATYGGNTPCVEIHSGNKLVICDAGSGIRDFGTDLVRQQQEKNVAIPSVFHIFISHLHWDHIQGFPFFPQAFVPGNKIYIYGYHDNMEKIFRYQQNSANFPVSISDMQADIQFVLLDISKTYTISGFTVKGIKQNHPGVSYGFSFEKDGKKVVYSTDAEHRKGLENQKYNFLEFFKDADLLIFDAQYALLEAFDTKKNWGHSSNILAVELSVRANVKRVCLFHHEHTSDDNFLDKFLADTRNYLSMYARENPLEIWLAYDGMKVFCD
jgi:phosphoribosyl 1,2-cyclic phosphodiesterase